MTWYQAWQPKAEPGTWRVYSNLGSGLLGMTASAALGQSFNRAMQQGLLPALWLHHTWLTVPAQAMGKYAQGYNKNNQPVRVTLAPLDAEAYGLKSSSADLIRFLEINLGQHVTQGTLRQAVDNTQRGYYQAGEFVQAMMWEYYPWPTSEATHEAPRQAWYNKTGSTNGSSTYVAFLPSEQLAVVMLANKWFPNEARVNMVWEIIKTLERP